MEEGRVLALGSVAYGATRGLDDLWGNPAVALRRRPVVPGTHDSWPNLVREPCSVGHEIQSVWRPIQKNPFVRR